MNLIKCIMKNSTCYKGTTKGGKVAGIVWHDTAAGNPWLKRYVQPYETDSNYAEMITLLGKNANRNDWNHSARQAGVHFFIGKLANGSVATVQCLELEQRCWGVGKGTNGSLNGVTGGQYYLQFEICDEGYKDKAYFESVYKEAVELTAYLCEKFGLDPKSNVLFNSVSVPTVLCHQDAYKLKLGSNHNDVYGWFGKFGKTMDDVRNDVAAAMGKVSATVTKPSVSTQKIKAGDIVSLASNATYYNGKAMPQWVKNMNWIVKSVANDRAVIDEDEDRKESICSAVNTKFLTVVGTGASTVTKPLAVGSVVKVASNAVWYTKGTAVPKWVIDDKWVVKSIVAERIVLGTNEKKTNTINSAIDKKYLTVV